MATTTPALDLAGRPRRSRGVAGWAKRLGLDWAYCLLGGPVAVLIFTVVVTGWSLALGLLITLVGLPLALAMLYVDRWLAQLERHRAAMVLDAPVASAYRPMEGSFWQRLRAGFTDPQKWKDLGWLLLVLPVGTFTFGVAVVAVSAIGYVLLPAWWWALPASDPQTAGLWDVTSWPLAFATAGVALALLPLVLLLLRATAQGSAALTRMVLGPSQAQLEQRVEQLAETRAGAVSAAADELERLERDLHDGAQARLVAVAMELGMAEDQLQRDPDTARARVAAARDETQRALAELRDLARGMRPGLLAERGLADAIGSLAARSAVPATVRVEIGEERPPAAAESAAYYVVAEALANAGKHAGASRVTIDVTRRDDRLVVLVADDGRGGADPTGRGLHGLGRRVAALDGTLTVSSAPGAGTHVRAEVPCGS